MKTPKPHMPTKPKGMKRNDIIKTVLGITQMESFEVFSPSVLAEGLLMELEKFGASMQQSTRTAILLTSATLMKQAADSIASEVEAQFIVDRMKRPG
jgi:hypothetical protein